MVPHWTLLTQNLNITSLVRSAPHYNTSTTSSTYYTAWFIVHGIVVGNQIKSKYKSYSSQTFFVTDILFFTTTFLSQELFDQLLLKFWRCCMVLRGIYTQFLKFIWRLVFLNGGSKNMSLGHFFNFSKYAHMSIPFYHL